MDVLICYHCLHHISVSCRATNGCSHYYHCLHHILVSCRATNGCSHYYHCLHHILVSCRATNGCSHYYHCLHHISVSCRATNGCFDMLSLFTSYFSKLQGDQWMFDQDFYKQYDSPVLFVEQQNRDWKLPPPSGECMFPQITPQSSRLQPHLLPIVISAIKNAFSNNSLANRLETPKI